MSSLHDVSVITHKEFAELFGIYHLAKEPLMLWGPAGIGKTEGIKEYCIRYAMAKGLKYSENIDDQAEDTFVCQIINLHQFDAAELKGLPVPVYEEMVTKFFQTNCMPRKGNGIIVFDEINLAPALIMASGYSLVNDRRLGDYLLPENWTTLCAGNTLSDRAFVQEMPFPLKNRMAHYFLKVPSSKEWCKDYAYKHNMPSIITNFLLFRPDCMYMFNPDSMNEQTAVGTHRTWTKAGKVINTLTDMKNMALIERVSAGFVGESTSKEMVAWWKLAMDVDIDEAFKTKTLPYTKKEDVDVTYAFIAAIIEHYKKNISDVTTATIVGWLDLFRKEDAAVILYQAVQANPDPNKFIDSYAKAKGAKAADKLMNDFIEMFK